MKELMTIPDIRKRYIKDIDRLPKTGGVYFLCNASEIIYIGCTSSLKKRIQSHLKTKTFNRVFYLCCGRKQFTTERHFIYQFNPTLNIQCNQPNYISVQEKKVLLLRGVTQ
jgi:excinuclease UvrABC nuclease subunit